MYSPVNIFDYVIFCVISTNSNEPFPLQQFMFPSPSRERSELDYTINHLSSTKTNKLNLSPTSSIVTESYTHKEIQRPFKVISITVGRQTLTPPNSPLPYFHKLKRGASAISLKQTNIFDFDALWVRSHQKDVEEESGKSLPKSPKRLHHEKTNLTCTNQNEKNLSFCMSDRKQRMNEV